MKLFSTENKQSIIAARSVTRIYTVGDTEVVGLKNIDLDIAAGQLVVVKGNSGSGKSTLLSLIAGLDYPDEGDVLISGEKANEKFPRERNISMVFQSYALYPHLTVEKNIMTPLIFESLNFWERLPIVRHFVGKKKKKSMEKIVKETAEQLHIGHLLKRKPGQLSG